MAKDRDKVKVPVKCRDRDRGLVRHRDWDRDNMFHLDRDFNVLVGSVDSQVTSPVRVHSSGQAQQSQEQIHVVVAPGPTTTHRNLIEGISWFETHSNREATDDREKLIYILSDISADMMMRGGRWCVLCLEISEEPSLSRRSPTLQSKMGLAATRTAAPGPLEVARSWGKRRARLKHGSNDASRGGGGGGGEAKRGRCSVEAGTPEGAAATAAGWLHQQRRRRVAATTTPAARDSAAVRSGSAAVRWTTRFPRQSRRARERRQQQQRRRIVVARRRAGTWRRTARHWQRRGEWRRASSRKNDALSDRSILDEGCDSTTRWKDLGVGCWVRISRRGRDVLRTM
ncbi:hypothetical protein Scep_015347 [Stephania cephalantha]|uniref:Uncharacterized protein n=1 Tax=Stephania cephalantha TaxID=152367 RepID=A0AAP0J2U2_9MAGN